jgi:hypothetical protein
MNMNLDTTGEYIRRGIQLFYEREIELEQGSELNNGGMQEPEDHFMERSNSQFKGSIERFFAFINRELDH